MDDASLIRTRVFNLSILLEKLSTEMQRLENFRADFLREFVRKLIYGEMNDLVEKNEVQFVMH